MATADVALTPEWLVRQRWFRAKRRAVASLTEVDRATLDHAELRIVEVAYADDGATDRYLVPVLDGREPRDGDGVWQALLGAIAAGATLHAHNGRFECDPTPSLPTLLPSPREAWPALDERRLGVEQSNTSVVLGQRLLLKLYRLLEPGGSPDLEISAFLTDAGFDGVPAVAGSMRYLPDEGSACAAAMLSAFIPSHGDAWGYVLECLATDPAEATSAVARIGVLTARLHTALASRPDIPGFPARRASDAELATSHASAEREADFALQAAEGRLDPLAARIRRRLAVIGTTRGTPVSRIHGDYHLGQLLAATSGEFVVIDFEGEPARALAERHGVASPLRDVAGMLRSFDYAAHTAARGRHAPGFDPAGWLSQARSAFLGAYGAIGPDQDLLVAFEVEKACYEVRYEANNRPDWIWLPIEALERLVSA